MPRPSLFLCRACMTVYSGEHVCESDGPAVYHITLTVEMRGQPSRLEETGAAVAARAKEAGLGVVHVNAKWVNHRDFPARKPKKLRARPVSDGKGDDRG